MFQGEEIQARFDRGTLRIMRQGYKIDVLPRDSACLRNLCAGGAGGITILEKSHWGQCRHMLRVWVHAVNVTVD